MEWWAPLVITGLNYVGVRPAAVFQTFAVLFLLAVGALLLFGSFVGGETGNMRPLFNDGVGGLIAVLVAVPFLFVGFDVIPQSAEEINLPFKQIGKLRGRLGARRGGFLHSGVAHRRVVVASKTSWPSPTFPRPTGWAPCGGARRWATSWSSAASPAS